MRLFLDFFRLIYVEMKRYHFYDFYVWSALGGKMKKNNIDFLVINAKTGNHDAFTELIQLHMKDMYKAAISILMNDEDTADAIQETILVCWEKIGTLKHNCYFKTWLIRILINKCYDIRKSQEKIISMETYEESYVEDVSNLTLKEALSQLDEKYRIVLMLYYGQGYRTSEIADILKIPKSTIQTRLERGRKQLKRYYLSN